MSAAATTRVARRAGTTARAGGHGARSTPRDAIDELADAVLEIAGPPVDAWAVAATLESRGMRDADAPARYGHRDVFDLADTVLERCRARARPAPAPPVATRSRRQRGRRLAGHLARGGFFFMPLALQSLALALVGYSQWASVHFTQAYASTVALAAGASFIVTAGFVHALGYLGPLYSEPGKDLLTERLTWSWLALATVALVAFGGLLIAGNALTGAYPRHLVEVGSVYYLLLGCLWLANGVLYMLRRYLAMALATAIGIGTVVLARRAGSLDLQLAQWIGLGTSVAFSLSYAAIVLRLRARRTSGDLRLARFRPRALLARAAAPFFCYGALYFALIFCDRLVAWSAGHHALPLWFQVRYELGLDWALLAAVGALAFLEHTVEELASRLAASQARFPAVLVTAHNSGFLRFYARQLVVVLVLAAVGALGVDLVVRALADAGALGTLARDVHGAVTPNVFAWAVAGYGLLACGLLNATFLLSLARPWTVVAALVAAVVIDAAVGVWLTREGPYWHSVIGLTAGCASFAAITAALVVRTLRHVDYHYFASF